MDCRAPETSWPVRRFCRQCLQAEPAPDFPGASLLRQHGVQEYLYDQLFSPDARGSEFQLPPGYELKVLKALVAKVEDSINDWEEYGISDNLMLRLANFSAGVSNAPVALAEAVKKHSVVYYVSALEKKPTEQPIPESTIPPTITLLENRATIAASGTTGIRTWDAALHLGEYLCQHRGLVQGKRVLELGAGTGYVSILCAKHLQAASCIATDGSLEVVNSMPANLDLNGLDAARAVLPRELAWGPSPPPDWDNSTGLSIDQSTRQTTAPGFDTVLGADITFDARDMPDLLATIRWCLASNSTATALISAAKRNKETFDTFIRLAAEAFDVVEVAFPVPPKEEQTGPFYSGAVPIHICRLQLPAGGTRIWGTVGV